MWMIQWMQRGAMIGFWAVGFALVLTLFLPMFAILFNMIGALLTRAKGNGETEYYDDEETDDADEPDSGDGDDA